MGDASVLGLFFGDCGRIWLVLLLGFEELFLSDEGCCFSFSFHQSYLYSLFMQIKSIIPIITNQYINRIKGMKNYLGKIYQFQMSANKILYVLLFQ